MQKIYDIVSNMKHRYKSGTVNISKYVNHSLADTLNRIDAYLFSKYESGDKDSLGREKPFFNIVTAAVNVWYRATDIDRKDIRILATTSKDYINSLIATHFLREWMNKNNYGLFLNMWGLTLARYGSAVVKTVDDGDTITQEVVPWRSIICDPVDFNARPVIEVLELSEEQLYERIDTHGYNPTEIEKLIASGRETLDGTKKDTDGSDEFYHLYEIHGKFKDEDGVYKNKMFVVSFSKSDNGEVNEHYIFEGDEEQNPYEITHLIPYDGRTLSVGAVEHLFDVQWMQNHTMKQIKDQLDLASKIILQTADESLLGRNILTDIDVGDIFVHAPGAPLTEVNNRSHDVTSLSNYAVMWKRLGNEITGISEAMLGATPKSGTPWRSTEAILQESYSLFDVMIEQKGLYIEKWMRERIIPYIKRKYLNNTKEIGVTLDDYDLKRVDKRFIRNAAIEIYNEKVIDSVLKDEEVEVPSLDRIAGAIGGELEGNVRYFVPDSANKKTWREQLKDMEWRLEVNVTGEQRNRAEYMTTLNTALQVAANPGFAQNPHAQKIVGKILETAGAMSPLELADFKATELGGEVGTPAQLPTNTQ